MATQAQLDALAKARAVKDAKEPADLDPMEKFEVIVTWAHEEKENQHLPIKVNVNNKTNRKEFLPGKKVILTRLQITALKSAIFDFDVPLPRSSGIYEKGNLQSMLSEAEARYPDCEAYLNEATGDIHVKKDEPRYNIQRASENF